MKLLLPISSMLLLVAAAYILSRGGWRRLLFAGVLFSLGIIGWRLGTGDPAKSPRKLLLVCSGPALDANPKPLEELLKKLESENKNLRCALLRLDFGSYASNATPAWHRVKDLTVKKAGAIRLDDKGEQWPTALVRTLRTVVQEEERATVAFFTTGLVDGDFHGLPLAGTLGQLIQEFGTQAPASPSAKDTQSPLREVDLLALGSAETRLTPLRVELSRSRLPALPLNQIPLTAHVSFEPPLGHVWRGGKVTARLYIILVPGAQPEVITHTWDLKDIPRMPMQLQLSEFKSDKRLAPLTGLHYLDVQVDLKTATSFLRLSGGSYLQVDPRPLTIVHPAQGSGALADAGWRAEGGIEPPPNPKELWGAYDQKDTELPWRMGMLGSIGFFTWSDYLALYPLPSSGTPAAAAAVPTLPPGVTVLIEPDQTQLDQLNQSQEFKKNLRDGEQIVIAGFGSPVTASATSHRWLPAVPAAELAISAAPAATGTKPPGPAPTVLRWYDWQPRLDVLLDSSAVLHGTVGHPAFHSQVEFVKSLCAKLDLYTAPGSDVAAVRDDAEFLTLSWQVPRMVLAEGKVHGETLLFNAPWTLANGLAKPDARKPESAGLLWLETAQDMAMRTITPSQIALRSQLINRPIRGEPLKWIPLDPQYRQPRAIVVFLAADLGQADVTNIADLMLHRDPDVGPFTFSLPASGAPKLPASFKDRRISVRVVPVALPPGGVGDLVKKWLPDASKTLQETLGTDAKVEPFRLTEGDATVQGQKFANELLQQWAQEPTLQVRQCGRVFDPRVAQDRRAPLRHLVLKAPDARSPDAFQEEIYAEVIDTTASATEQRLPVVVGSPYGEGFVTVLAYSPFAGDMWVADSGTKVAETKVAGITTKPYESRMKNVRPRGLTQRDTRGKIIMDPGFDGWGIQRLIDPAVLGLGAYPLGHLPQIRSMSWRAEDSRLIIQATLPSDLRQQSRLSSIEVSWDGSQKRPLEVETLDFATGAVQFGVTLPPESAGKVGELSWGDNLRAQALSVVFPPSIDGHGQGLELVLTQLASILGTGRVQADDMQTLTTRPLSHSYRSVVWIFVLLALLLSPLARSWTAVILKWKHWRDRRNLASRLYRPPPGGLAVHAEATSNDWGRSIGQPKALAQAGLPAGERPFEPADSLKAAKVVTLSYLLFPELPTQKPIVRLKHVSMNRRAWILVDDPGRLASPYQLLYPSREQYSQTMVGVIAALLLPTGTEMVLRWARPQEEDHQLLIQTPGCLSRVEKFMTQYDRPSRLGTVPLKAPSDLVADEDVFLISDLRTLEWQEISDFIDEVANVDGRLILCALRSPEDWKVMGLVEDEASGRLLDRTEYRPEDLKREDRTHEQCIRSAVGTRGGHVVDLVTSFSATDAFAQLRHFTLNRL